MDRVQMQAFSDEFEKIAILGTALKAVKGFATTGAKQLKYLSGKYNKGAAAAGSTLKQRVLNPGMAGGGYKAVAKHWVPAAGVAAGGTVAGVGAYRGARRVLNGPRR